MAVVRIANSPHGDKLAETCRRYFDVFLRGGKVEHNRVEYKAFGRNAPEDDTEILVIFQTNSNGLYIAVNWITKEEYEKSKQ